MPIRQLLLASGLLLLSACEPSPPAAPIPPLPRAPERISEVAPEVTEVTEAPPPSTEYFGGTARAQPRSTGPAGGLRFDNRRGIELSFIDTDIRRVVDAILGETLRLDYTVDPKVQGTITLRTARPVARGSLLPALEAALASADAALVQQNGLYRVVPRNEAQSTAGLARPLSGRDRAQPGFALEIVPLEFASAREVQKVIEGSGAKGAVIQVDEARNHIIIAGSSQERSSVRRLIESLDVDWVRGMSFALYRTEAAGPDEVLADLERIFEPPISGLKARVRLVPLPRLNALLGISASREDLREMEGWIRRLDVSAGGDKRRLFVYNIQNGRAADLANSLSQVVTGESSTAVSPTAALPANRDGDGQGVQRADTDSRAAPALEPVGSARPVQPVAATPGGNRLRIVPNDENNSLLIYATAAEYNFVRDALAQLDVPPRQVLIEAILAEVTLTNDLRYGLQWFFSSDDNQVTLSGSSSGGVSQAFPGLSYLYSGSADARVVLNAIQSRTNVRVLSSPKLVVLNNQTATLQVGDQVPIVTQQAQSTSAPGAPVVNTVELRDTGVILKVTPRVNDNGLVVIDVSQEVSDVSPTTTSGIDSPTIQQRKLTSTVAARSGTTVALGGLIRNSLTRGRSGVPLLSSVPVLGNLFRQTTRDDRRTELIVLLTPTVMRDGRETEAVVNDLVDGFKTIRPLIQEGVDAQVPGRTQQR